MDLSKIVAIPGKPGIYEMLSNSRRGAVVESLVDHKRMPVFANQPLSSLNEITMYGEERDVPLREIFQNIYRKEDGKEVPFDPKKAGNKEMFDYLSHVLPNCDKERIHASDLKKLYGWYNILQAAGKVDLEEMKEETAEKPQEDSGAKD
ncbi:MAG: DUF5606 domain-containing protein [Bacteroidales bacterium]|nr:DUF5606 domain-containing protein [Bacteroidales bacterium]